MSASPYEGSKEYWDAKHVTRIRDLEAAVETGRTALTVSQDAAAHWEHKYTNARQYNRNQAMIDHDTTIHVTNQSFNLNILEVRVRPISCTDNMQEHRCNLRYNLGQLEYEICDACCAIIVSEHLSR